jgi:chromate transport protein ChrA
MPPTTLQLVFLGLYIVLLFVIVAVLFVLMRRYVRQGRKRAQWVLVAVTLAIVIAHWTWPFLIPRPF